MALDGGFVVPLDEQASLIKKTTVSRSWILFNQNGESNILDLDKYSIIRRMNIHARDLRILDPLLSYPSTILGREGAIILNLEHIKAIITAEEELQRRLALPGAVYEGQGEEDEQSGVPNDTRSSDDFPFELRALEVMLEAICSFLDARTTELETETYPALDELTSKISSRNLDRVRKLKSAMTRLTNRVQKVSDELQQLLDDEEDMEDLYLSRKLSRTSSPASGSFTSYTHLVSPTKESKKSKTSRTSAVTLHDENDVEELEMLLEAYFMQIESTLSKLNTLHEYIDDTEDYINIQLDNHRNQLIQLELFISSGNLCLSMYSLVAAIFGMNIPYTWKENHGYVFKWVVVLTGMACGSLFLSIITYARQKGLVGS
ncbi:Magnesium transporter MRS2-I [Ancistrocladus abbreviatus]